MQITPIPKIGIGVGQKGRGVRVGLFQDAEALQVVLGPASLVLDHALEGFGREGIPRAVKRNRHAPAIGVTVVVLVGAGLAIEDKAVSDERREEVSGSQAPELSIVDRHGLDGDGNLRLCGYLHLVWRAFRDRFLVLQQAFHYHLHHLFKVM